MTRNRVTAEDRERAAGIMAMRQRIAEVEERAERRIREAEAREPLWLWQLRRDVRAEEKLAPAVREAMRRRYPRGRIAERYG